MTYEHPTAFQLWGPEEEIAIDRVRKSGQWTMGREVRAFEEEFADWHGRRHGIMVNSGSSANLIAVAALRHMGCLADGALVAVPSIAWSTTYAPLIQHNANLSLIDVDDSWNANPEQDIPDVSLIIACSILGNPAWLDHWRGIAKAQNVPLLEDNCESLGAMADADTMPGPYGSTMPYCKLAGTYGDLSTFSFFWSHQLSAIEGGMILTDNWELADLCCMLRAHGWTRDLDHMQIQPGRAAFDDEYDFRVFGYNVRPLEMHAAIARAQLKKLPRFIEARRTNYQNFRQKVTERGLPVGLPRLRGSPSPFGLHFMCRSRNERALLVSHLRTNGIDARLPTGGSFRMHEYGKPFRDQQTPQADNIHERGLFLGNAPWDQTEAINRIVEVMAGFFWNHPLSAVEDAPA